MDKYLNLEDYRSKILFYFKIRTVRFNDIDPERLYLKFAKHTYIIPNFPPGNIELWIKYQAHIFLMDELKNKPDIFYKLFIELLYSYSAFYKRAEFNHYKAYYPEQLFFDIEFSTVPLRTLVTESGYPNRILCYCYKCLLSGWTPQRIASELSNMNLDSILDQFTIQYAEESGMHKLFVDYMFLPLRKGLNETLNYYIELYGNDDEKFLHITKSILFTRTGSTKLDDYLMKNELHRKAHMISVWCNRIKSSLIKNIIRFLKIQDYYCNSDRRIELE